MYQIDCNFSKKRKAVESFALQVSLECIRVYLLKLQDLCKNNYSCVREWITKFVFFY